MARLSDRAAGAVGWVGEYLAEECRHGQLSLRRVHPLPRGSNPSLSQIERGLRKPSADVLQQLAKALRISAETLYIRAGILEPHEHHGASAQGAVLSAPALTERQRQVLLDIYNSFRRENDAAAD